MLHGLSLRFYVIGGVLITILSSVLVGTWISLADQESRLIAEAEEAHGRSIRILALGLQKALWDLSPESASPLALSVLEDSRIVKVVVFDAKNEIFLSESREQRRLGQVLTKESPIIVDDQIIGKISVEFSMAQATSEIRKRMFDIILLSLAEIVGCVLVLAILLHYRVLTRIDRLKSEAQQISERKLSVPFIWIDQDEIGKLGQSLESTRKSLANLFAELEVKNQDLSNMNIQLEQLVEDRTATIRTILNHVKTGFLLIDRKFKVLDGYTKSCESLLSRTKLQGQSIQKILNLNRNEESHLQLAIEQVFDDFMPEMVSLGQIPREFVFNDRTIALEGSTIRDATGNIIKILFTIIDISLLKAAETENQINRSVINVMQNLNAFYEYIQDFRERIENCYSSIRGGDTKSLRSDLHTLKGNSAAFGLRQLSILIHNIEDHKNINTEHVVHIEKGLKEFLASHYALLNVSYNVENKRTISLDEITLEQLKSQVNQFENQIELKSFIDHWISEILKDSVGSLLLPFSSYLSKLAKERSVHLDFIVEGGECRVDRADTSEIFQMLIHLLRNAVDHGLEPSFERKGKPERAQLNFRFKVVADRYEIEVEDDGRGINIEQVKNRAVLLGLITPDEAETINPEEAINLIFHSGLSTAQAITEVSGRGVGMGAVKGFVESMGGAIKIKSQLGKGTTIYLSLPINSKRSKLSQAA